MKDNNALDTRLIMLSQANFRTVEWLLLNFVVCLARIKYEHLVREDGADRRERAA